MKEDALLGRLLCRLHQHDLSWTGRRRVACSRCDFTYKRMPPTRRLKRFFYIRAIKP